MPCGHLNAMRFAQKPLPQPAYSFLDVPTANNKTLEGSSLQRVTNREHFQTCMAEMLLLGKEAVRRRQHKAKIAGIDTSGAKPLSLEYLADRLDIDDPCFGYLVRSGGTDAAKESSTSSSSDENKAQDNNTITTTAIATNSPQQPAAGMLQGFITVTTFTNWQTSFAWNSLHHDAYSFDSKEMKRQRLSGERQWDADGSLAKDLQATVHYGNVHGEGIVWPRIAEISLLGGLGCGRALVKTVIEELETMKPNADRNYDFVVLQATDNSIPFYESIGFVRVGGVMEDKEVKQRRQEQQSETTIQQQQQQQSDGNDAKTPARKLSQQEDDEASPLEPEIVSSDITTYTTQKRGESPLEIAKKLGVDVWDILFLNKGLFGDPILPASKLLLGTTLQVPVPPPKKKLKKKVFRAGYRASSRLAILSPSKMPVAEEPVEEEPNDEPEEATFYTAKENDTPRWIAKHFHLDCKELIKANYARLPGLIAKSRLKAGTQVKISHFHMEEEPLTAYSHWSFPDDQIEDGEPSYMMAYRLNRKYDNPKKAPSFVETLAVPVNDYEPTPLLWHPPPPAAKKESVQPPTKEAAPVAASQKPKLLPKMPTCIGDSSTTDSPGLIALDANSNKPIRVRVVSDGAEIKASPVKHKDTLAAANVPSTKPPAMPLELLPKPKRSLGPYMIFARDQRRNNADVAGMHITESSRYIADLWASTSQMIKQRYIKLANDAKKKWEKEKEAYENQQALLALQPPEQRPQSSAVNDGADNSVASVDGRQTQEMVGLEPHPTGKRRRRDQKDTLYNTVVKVKPEAVKVTRTSMDHIKKDSNSNSTQEPQYYKYWFVLTYIPDLQWCHLAPLEQVGTFGPEDKKPRLIGRPKYKLVNEELGQEVDLSSRYVVTVKSRVAKNTPNADKEEWDIVDDNEDVSASSSDEDGSKTRTTKKKLGPKKKESSSTVRVTTKRVFEAAFGGLALMAASQPDQTKDSAKVDHPDGPPPHKMAKTSPGGDCRCGLGLRCPIHPPGYFDPPAHPMGGCPPGYAHGPAPFPPPPQVHYHYNQPPHGYVYYHHQPPHDAKHFSSAYAEHPPPHMQYHPHHLYYGGHSGRTTPTVGLAPTSDSSPELSIGQEAAI